MFLVQSRLVAMGVSAASLATAIVGVRMSATTDAAELDTLLARAV